MTEYVKSAEAEAAAYEKERKKQAADTLSALAKAAEDERQAAAADAAAAIREQHETAMTATDTAAVQKAITLSQAKERLANLGLTASGAEHAAAHAAAVTERRTAQTAHRTRDQAVAALTEALRQQETAIENERAAAALKATQDAAQDVSKQRDKLLTAAYRAAADEEEARISAAKKNSAVEEQNRRTALREMYNAGNLNSELYARALAEGWTVVEAIQRKGPYLRYSNIAEKAGEILNDQGLDEMAHYLAMVGVSDVELDMLCHGLQISRKAVVREMNAFRTFLDSSEKAQKVKELFERGIDDINAVL